MKKNYLILFVQFFVSLLSFGQFTENKGQIFDESGKYREDVHFVSQFSGVNIYFTDHGVVHNYVKITPAKFYEIQAGKIENPYTDQEWEDIMRKASTNEFVHDGFKSKGIQYRIDMTFPGAVLENPIGEDVQLQKNQYFLPQHTDAIKDVSLFGKIRYKNAYPGIDLVFYLKDGGLKYDFEVGVNAKPELIKILYKGHQKISTDKEGNVIVEILPGKIIEHAPISFQGKEEIRSSFTLSNDTLSFNIGNYDRSKLLTIDPSLTWSTYFHDGTTSGIFTTSRPAWDSAGNMYQALNTYNNTVYPLVNPGGSAYYNITAGSTGIQVVIQKYNTSRQIVWATYYPASQSSRVSFSNQSIGIDPSDNLYVIGEVDYVYGPPYTFQLFNPGGGAYYETELGNSRNFILKFNSAGQRLWATMFTNAVPGSSSGLDLFGVSFDSSGRLYITGTTYTPSSWASIPLVNPGGSHYYRASPPESQVPTLHRFSTTGALQWSTYISQGVASSYNDGECLAIDASNNIFLSGSVSSATYTLVNPGGGAYQDGTTTGGRKISVFKFASTGALTWNTLYGGTTSANSILWQDPRDIIVNSTGSVFVVGRSNCTNFPTFNPGGGAYMKTTLSTGSTSVYDGVIMKFSNTGVRNWATYCGGNGTSDGTDFWGVAKDASDNITVGGVSRTTNTFPVLNQAGSFYQASQSGSYGTVLTQFNSSGVQQWATYYGNNSWMSSGGFGGDGAGKYVMFGTANSISTVNPGGGAYFQAAHELSASTSDFIAEFSTCIAETNTTSTATICETSTKALTSSGPGVGTWSVVSGGGTISGTTYTPANISSNTTVTVRYVDGCGTGTNIAFLVNSDPGTASNTTSNAAICEGATKALTGTPAGGTWSVVSGGGTISGTTYTSPTISSNTTVTVRYTIAANGTCAGSTSDVAFTVNDNLGTASNSTSAAAICEGDTKALAASPAGGTWSVVSGGGTISGTTYTSPVISSNTTVTVRYTIAANGACPATTSDVAFTVNDNLGTASNSTSTAAICEGSTKALTGSPAGGTWSVVSGGGTISGTTYTSPLVASNTTVTVRYTIAANGACPATTSDVAFTVNDNLGTASNSTSTASICEGDTKALTASPAGGTWSVVSGGGTISGTTYTSPVISSNTTVTVRYTIATNGACPGSTSDVAFTVNDNVGTASNSTSNAAICEGSTKALTGSPAGGTWSVVSGGGTISGTTYTSPLVASNTTVTVRYTIAANGACPATTSDIAFTVNDNLGTASNSTSTAAICEGDTKALTATPAGGTWSVVSGGGTISGTTYNSPVISSNTTVTVRYTIATNGACPGSTSDAVFTVNDNLGSASNTTSTAAICEGSTKALTGTPAGGTWSVVSGGGTISGTTYTSPVISSNTTVTVRYTIAANGACPATTSDIAFTVNDNLGTASNATNNTAICEGDTKALTATPAGGTWSVVSGGGSISGTTYTSPVISSNTIVTVRYTIATNGACPGSTSDVAFTVNDNPGAANNTTSVAAICEGSTKAVSGSPAGGTWSVVSGGGTISGTTYTSPVISANTTVTVRYTIAANGTCPASTSDVAFTVNDNLGTATNSTSTADLCEGDTRALTATPTGGTWSVLSGGGTITGSTYTTPSISTNTTVTIRYTIATNGACPGSISDVAFIVNDNIGLANNTSSTASLCEGDTKALTASPAGGTWSIVSGGGTISGTTYNSPSISANTTVTVRYTIAANGTCPATNSDVVFIVNDNLGTASNTTSTAAICEDDTKALTASPAGGTWSVVSGGGTILGSTYTSPTISSNTTVTVRYTISANGACSGSISDVAFLVNDNLGTANNTTSTAAICEGDTKNLIASPAGGSWVVVSGGGTISGSTYTSPSVLANTNVTVRYTIASNGTCPTTTSDVVFIVNDYLGAASNTTSATAICEGDTKALSATPAGGTWSVESGGGTIVGTTYTSPSVSANTNVTVRYTIPANGACPATISDVAFNVNDNLGAANNTTSTAAICEGDTKSLTASPAGGSWSVISGGGTISGTTYTSPSVSANTTVTVQYTISPNGSCPATTSDVSFIVNDNLGTASNMTSSSPICEGSALALVATPAGGTWSIESGGGTISGSTYTSPSITGNSTVIVRYAIPTNGACLGSSSDVTFTVNDNLGIAINTTSTAAICEGSNVVLSASPAGGTWTIENGGGTISGTTYSSPAVTTNTNVTVRYTIGANGACQGTTSDASFIVSADPSSSLNAQNDSYVILDSETGLFDVTANDLPSSLLITSIGSPENGTASIVGNQISYTSNTDFRGLDSMTYVVCHSVCTSSCSDAVVYIQVDSDVIDGGNGTDGNGNVGGWILTPNGDGKDDVFYIDGLYEYQKNEIVIFNRWGDEIYSASPYKNDWNATSPKDVVSGTYFFILKLTLMDNTEKVVKGFIHVEK